VEAHFAIDQVSFVHSVIGSAVFDCEAALLEKFPKLHFGSQAIAGSIRLLFPLFLERFLNTRDLAELNLLTFSKGFQVDFCGVKGEQYSFS